ncbi:MAG: methylated-DNA--[protein]-cysteine S-methyltransferase [Endomicrobiia bacterium]
MLKATKYKCKLKKILKEIKKYPEFYQKVWLACLKIPEGQTRTYKWIAEKIGHPNAYRAVGNALSKNPFAGLIPCHRVIREDGKLGGYSGGIRKKLELLKKERIKISKN